MSLLFITLALSFTAHAQSATSPAVAFHYGITPPIDELQAFDWVVLDPRYAPPPQQLPSRHTQWFAYVSVGELDSTRDYAAAMPRDGLRGVNPAWNTQLIDHSAPGWVDFFAEQVIGTLWQQGWRCFFLDTLDSHHLFAHTPQDLRAQEDALVRAIETVHTRYPGIRLMTNRGFEILPRLKGRVQGVTAESLFERWDARAQRYGAVPAADHDWLLAQLQRVKNELQIPVVVVDYVPRMKLETARATAARIRALGFIPWVSSAALDTLGVGDVEVQPRRIALVTDWPANSTVQQSVAFRYLAAPLNWLGYIVDVFNVQETLPEHLLQGRHAALLTWFSQPVAELNPAYAAWLQRQVDGGLPLVLMHQHGLDPDSPLLRQLGFARVSALDDRDLAPRVATQSPWVGFEIPVPARVHVVAPLRWDGTSERASGERAPGERAPGERALQLESNQQRFDAIGITPWGGFALEPYAVRLPLLNSTARWIVNPVEFLQRALHAENFPVPDVTTEGGKRLLLVHIDGDGFASRAERPGAPPSSPPSSPSSSPPSSPPFAGQVLLDEVIGRYRIPHTASVIQGEIAENGMFPKDAPQLEAIAQRLFAQPHVEIASHSYSHPFTWRQEKTTAAKDTPITDAAPYGTGLPLPGYRFDLRTEINGAIDYINTRLAPINKRTQVFLWTGDTMPTVDALAQADAAGVLNMNGGDTLITQTDPTWTEVAGLGVQHGAHLHVFAPNQNENVYTNLWHGPYYGFERVIETFRLTEQPLRLKPINIYYHVYSATRTASLTALHRVYAWALAQPVVPVYASDYIRKVNDFHHLAVARDWRHAAPTWRLRGAGAIRTARLPADGTLNLQTSRNVAGVKTAANARYVHLTNDAADLVLSTAPSSSSSVYVAQAQGWIDGFSRDAQGIRFGLSSYTRASLQLGAARACRAFVDGREIQPQPQPQSSTRHADLLDFTLPDHEVTTTPHHVLVHVRCAH